MIERLNRLIAGIEIAMLTSVHANGQLRSRPMATQGATDDGFLWFFSAQHSSKVDAIRHEHQVNVAYSDPASMRFVSVCGPCELVRNRDIAAELWRPEYSRFFPGGVEDPDLILLKVTINSAEYWDAEGRTMRTLNDGELGRNETLILGDQRSEVA